MLDRVREKRSEIYNLAREYKAEKLWVFGSVARKEERPDSDIDFLVSFPRGVTIDNYTRLGAGLEKLFSRKIDLISERCLSGFGGGQTPKTARQLRGFVSKSAVTKRENG